MRSDAMGETSGGGASGGSSGGSSGEGYVWGLLLVDGLGDGGEVSRGGSAAAADDFDTDIVQIGNELGHFLWGSGVYEQVIDEDGAAGVGLEDGGC